MDMAPVVRRDVTIDRQCWDITRYPPQPDTASADRVTAQSDRFVGLEFRRAGVLCRVQLSAASLPSESEFLRMDGIRFAGLLARALGRPVGGGRGPPPVSPAPDPDTSCGTDDR
jgi:hypothetical protein